MTAAAFITDPNPEIYLNGNWLALDFETTNIEHGSAHEGRNNLLLACWVLGPDHPASGEGRRDFHCWGSEFEQSELLEHISRADYIVAHNAKFELGWLSRCGADLRQLLPYCTQIGEYVLAGNRKPRGGLGLSAAASRYGIGAKHSCVSVLIGAGVCPSDIPRGLLLDYCQNDTSLTATLFERQRVRLRGGGLLPVAYCRNIVTPCLVDIESRGMCLDPERVKVAHADYSERYANLLRDFEKLTGGINPKSGKQMREYLYTTLGFEEATDHKSRPLRTAGGKKGEPQPRTDKKVLPLLKASTPEQKEFKRLAIELAKLKVPVQNLTKMLNIVNSGEPIVYANINQTVTDTHRLSSSGRRGGFQFHNFDRAFKPLFKARNAGSVVVEADAPQLEFRVAAYLGGDAVAKRDIETGADIHAFTAEVLGTSRQNAKAHTFKPLYGGNSGTAAEKRYYAAFRERYAGIYKTQTEWTYEVARSKRLRTASGLVFYWPDTEIKDRGYITNTASIFNYPIQSFATADIIPLTLVLLWHELADVPEAMIVNTIHDSVVLECPSRLLDTVVEKTVDCFTRKIYPLLAKLYGVAFDVPLGVGIKHGSHWSEGTEQKYEPNSGV